MRRRARTVLGVVLVVAPLATAGAAQESAEEREALKNARILDIVGTTRDIVGITRDVEGVLRELGAQVSDQEIRIGLAADVLFDFASADLKPAAFPTLEKVGEAIKTYPRGSVLIEGHTDNVGADEYNLALSERRAASVRDWLVQHANVTAARTSIAGHGETRPAAPNAKPDGSDDPDGRQRNRRVELTIQRRAN